MTRDEFNNIRDLDHDIDILEVLKREQDRSYWVGFRIPKDSQTNEFITEGFITDWLREDFKKFVADELEVAKQMFGKF